jgi:hypothetical protein
LQALVDAGIALAFNPQGTGIAAQWAAKLKPHVQLTNDANVCETACVSTTGVWFNESFLSGLTAAEIVFLVAHETMHIALGHLDQSVHLGVAQYVPHEDGSTQIINVPGKEHESHLLGIAQDAFINETQLAARLGALPAGGVTKATLNEMAGEPYPDTDPFTSEAIYHWLVARVKPKGGKGGGKGKGPGGPGGTPGQPGNQPAPGKGCSPQGLPGNMGKLEQEQMRAAIREHALGLPPGKGTALAEAFAPQKAKVDWRRILRNAFQTACEDAEDRSERSFARPNRRDHDEIIMPGQIGTEARIAVIVDVSGSVGPDWVARAAAYVLKLQDDFPQVRVWLGSHTSECVWHGWLKPGGDAPTLKKALGFSGGTDASDTYERCAEADKRGFDVLVHFTDCELPSWPKPPARRFIIGALVGNKAPNPPPHGARVVEVSQS